MTDSANSNDVQAARSCSELPTPNNELEEKSFNEGTDEAQPKLTLPTYTQSLKAEQFINIPELRLMLYGCMAGPKTDQILDFSGLFFASRNIFVEAEAEIVNLRCKFIKDSITFWSNVFGEGNISISNPQNFSHLNTATVTLSRKLFESRFKFTAEDLVPKFPLLNVALDRLEVRIATSDEEL